MASLTSGGHAGGFGRSAASLAPDQAALLAGAIINPRVYSPGRPNARLLRRQKIILARMGGYAPPAAVPVSAAPLEKLAPVEPAAAERELAPEPAPDAAAPAKDN